MRIVFLTAGAAGMYCGSCMHDNALARALRDLGVDCLLQPLYTPIRTDEASIASKDVFFGGVNVYLLQKIPGFRYLPGPIRRLLDRPRFLSWATRGAGSTNASMLGDLAVSMLRGEDGRQRDEVGRLVAWLRDEMKPDVIIFSNLLIGGCIPAIRRELPQTKILILLQGDDSFLDHLPSVQRQLAITELSRLSQQCDAIIVNSQFYGEKMTRALSLPASKVRVLPLSIDTSAFMDFATPADQNADVPNPATMQPITVKPVTIGYLARVAPEKGLHHLVDAFIELAKRPGCEHVRLHVTGWLGKQNEAYLKSLEEQLQVAGLRSRYEYKGSPNLIGKLDMLRHIDLLCVPTAHEEPKGLFVLEAMAAGVPVVQPARGAFPELIGSTGGGLLVQPDDPTALADGLHQLVSNPELRFQLGQAGRRSVLENHTTAAHAASLLRLIETLSP